MSLKQKNRPADQAAVVTANRLVDGRVVWLAADGRWVEAVRHAAVLRGSDLADALATGARDERQQVVVGVYATDIVDDGATPVPLLLRERIRGAGPSIPVGAEAMQAGATQAGAIGAGG